MWEYSQMPVSEKLVFAATDRAKVQVFDINTHNCLDEWPIMGIFDG